MTDAMDRRDDRHLAARALASAAWALDERDHESFVGCFAPDASIVRRIDGGEDRRWRAQKLSAYVDAYHRGRHFQDGQSWNLDLVVEREGERLLARSNGLRVASVMEGTTNVLLADSEVIDVLVPHGDGYRIAHREIRPLGFAGPLGDELRRVALQGDPSNGVDPVDTRAELADLSAIETLFAEYAWALDRADVAGVVRTFDEDAVMQDPFGRFQGTGPDGIPRFFEHLFSRGEFAGRTHWVNQIRLRPLADGYRVDSYALVPAAFSGGAVDLHLAAFYRDHVVFRNDRWLFRERLVGARWPREEEVL